MNEAIPKNYVQSAGKRALYYFREISRIPRGSGNESAIADYLISFAQTHKLLYRRSTEIISGRQTHNVLIEKPASCGYESREPVILQAHTDMVCQKLSGSVHDFTADPIELSEKDGVITANGTTLGADDGIGVALILAILDSDEASHPPIEALFTSDEEDGMTGVMALNRDFIKGKRLINLDTEEEGTLYCGCAGGVDAVFRLPCAYAPIPEGYACLEITLSGLHGGHSGIEIHNGYANAHKLLARVLSAVREEYPALLVSFDGGDKRNVIPLQASAVIAARSDNTQDILALVNDYECLFRREYAGIEERDGKRLSLSAAMTEAQGSALTRESFDTLLQLLLLIPNGVQDMHGRMEGLVETSCNLGVVRQEAECFYICSLIRSFRKSKKRYMLERMRCLAALSGAEFTVEGDYPDWEPSPESELVLRFKNAYETAFPGSAAAGLPHIKSLHAGLECGYVSAAFPDMDMISCGPTITGAHTPGESLDTASAVKLLDVLLHVLAGMK